MRILDQSISIYRYFEDIAQIPHGSYQEEKIADYVEEFAKNHKLDYQRDEMHNIIIFKPASKGYEGHPTLMLQGHMDMVNEKNNDSQHDFDNDPLDLYIEDGYLSAHGTTLGADDGVAVAYMLAILDDATLKHPALECVFTVQEEVGLYGAAGLDMSAMQAEYMIGLDSETEGETCTSSSGGCDLLITKSVMGQDNTSPVYVLEVKGLLGGHSGACIHLGRGNANKIVARILMTLLKNGIDIRLIDVTGGLKNNAIPRECVVAFASDSDYQDIERIIYQTYDDIKQELRISEPDFQVYLSQDECDVCMTSQDSEQLIHIMYLCPNGMKEQSQVIDDLTILSLNMGVIRTHEDSVTIDYSIRSPIKSARDELVNQIETIVLLFNGCIQVSGDYPGWDYDPNSKIRTLFKQFYKERTGQEVREVATHGGLETGLFKGKKPHLDILTLGPNMEDIHTPDERLELESFLRTYEILVDFIATL